jgi:hypothetical protein
MAVPPAHTQKFRTAAYQVNKDPRRQVYGSHPEAVLPYRHLLSQAKSEVLHATSKQLSIVQLS